jgi:tetratricopeptide (TPR) repeat protein
MRDFPSRRQEQLISLTLAVVTFAAYWPVLSNGFITYDDGSYITENPAVLSGINATSLRWAFNLGYSGNWHPLTWMSHMLDVSLFGVTPAAHHLMGLLLHIASSVLLFLLFQRMTGLPARLPHSILQVGQAGGRFSPSASARLWRDGQAGALWPSAFVAAVFALHPLHVQSVAWAAERKDVLSTLFWILTILAYVRYVERSRRSMYLLALVLFALGLMAKPMLVTLPFVLLLMDYWPLGRMRFNKKTREQGQRKHTTGDHLPTGKSLVSLIIEKLPFLGLALASSVITFFAQRQGGAVAATESLSLDLRVTNALVSYILYIGKTLWPSNLAFFYPHPAEHLPVWQAIVAGLVLLAVTALSIQMAKHRPYVAFGWLWYLVTLVPVIGIVQVGLQAMADRYMYVPIIGLSVVIGWAVADLAGRMRVRVRLAGFAAIVATAAMAATTFVQAGYWHDSRTLYEHAINVTDHNWVAHANLGVVLAKEGRVNDAMAHYTQALQIKPDYVEAHRLLGFHLADAGKIDEAIAHFKEAIRIKPADAEAHHNLGSLLARQGKIDEAMVEYNEALKIDSTYVDSHFNMGFFLSQQGKTEEAIAQYKEALHIKPDYADARLNLGNLLVGQGKTDEAIAEYVELTKRNPQYEKGHYVLGYYLAERGKLDEAIAEFTTALRINPNYTEVHLALGQTLTRQGKNAEAQAEFARAQQLQQQGK